LISSQFAEKLAAKARNSISNYCITECKAYCCRKGYLVLTSKQADLIMDSKNTKDRKCLKKTGKKSNSKIALNLGYNNQDCPSLKNYKCIIHNNKCRPTACKEFPIFIWGKKRIRLSNRCPAVREDLFYPYIAKFKLMGYSIANSNK
jgi:Fe-S-cluster containining protein